MNSISLSVYEVTIYKKNGSPKSVENISDFNNGKDLMLLFQKLPEYLNSTGTASAVLDIKASSKRLLINSKEFKPFGRVVSGEVETGEYGTENNIIDEEGKKVGKKEKSHSTMIPFYFMCDLERDSKRALLILQRFGKYGMFTIFSNIIKKEFEKQNPSYTIRIAPLVSKRAMDAIMKEGVIKKMSFQSVDTSKIDHTITARNSSDNFKASDVRCEYNIIAKRNKAIAFKNSVSKFLGADAKVSDYITLKEFEYNNVKISFEINGKSQTINLNNWQKFSPDIDITSKVTLNDAGYPVTKEVEKASLDLINDIKTDLLK